MPRSRVGPCAVTCSWPLSCELIAYLPIGLLLSALFCPSSLCANFCANSHFVGDCSFAVEIEVREGVTSSLFSFLGVTLAHLDPLWLHTNVKIVLFLSEMSLGFS